MHIRITIWYIYKKSGYKSKLKGFGGLELVIGLSLKELINISHGEQQGFN